MGTIIANEVPPDRSDIPPYVLALSGLILMLGGHYTGKRNDWN